MTALGSRALCVDIASYHEASQVYLTERIRAFCSTLQGVEVVATGRAGVWREHGEPMGDGCCTGAFPFLDFGMEAAAWLL